MTTLPEKKHEQNPREMITILIANADNAKIQHSDLYTDGLLSCFHNIEPLISHPPMLCNGML